MDASSAGRVLSASRPKKQITCRTCGRVFEGVGRRAYCSESCRHKAYIQRKRASQRMR